MRLGIIVLLLSTVFATVWQSVLAQSDGSKVILNDIVECFVQRDTERLSSYFNERIEITLSGESKEYAKSQARYVMKDFLDSYPPAAFTFNHQGATENTIYALGTYRSPEGVFEVDLFLKLDEADYVINQIKFEKEE
jgi:hypothetical protein